METTATPAAARTAPAPYTPDVAPAPPAKAVNDATRIAQQDATLTPRFYTSQALRLERAPH